MSPHFLKSKDIFKSKFTPVQNLRVLKLSRSVRRDKNIIECFGTMGWVNVFDLRFLWKGSRDRIIIGMPRKINLDELVYRSRKVKALGKFEIEHQFFRNNICQCERNEYSLF